MTRRQVARRLGKSLTTIRRIEGVLLHPNVDSRGVHRFDSTEVESLAQDVETGRVMLGQQLRPLEKDLLMDASEARGVCTGCMALDGDLQVLRRRLETQAADHQRELAALRAQHAADHAEQNAVAQDLLEQVAELVAILDT